jgi:hypothetical protein
MSDRAKEASAQLVVTVFLITTFVLHIVYRVLSWRSLLFALIGMFAVSLSLGVAFYLIDVVIGRAFARFSAPGPRTDAIVLNVGCLKSVIEVAATIAVTTLAFRAVVLSP